MKLSGAIQEALLALLCYDDSAGGGAFVKGLVPLEAFDAFYIDLAEAASDFITRYGTVPGEHTLDLIETLQKKKTTSAKIFERLFESVETTKDGVNREYVLGHAREFVRMQQVRQCATELVDCLEQDDSAALLDAEKILAQARDNQIDLFQPGTFLHDRDALRFLDDDYTAMPTGIKILDRRRLGPARKRLHLFLAALGRGKSWWLVHLAKIGLMHGLRVLIVSLEMSEEEYACRLLQSFFSLTQREGEVQFYNIVPPEGGAPINFAEARLERPSMADANIGAFLAGHQRRFLANRPPLLVKEFPSGKLTIPQLEGYLSGLEGTGFLPDLVLVDYVDLMDWRVVSPDKRIGIGENTVGLRGIAGERNIAVASCTQGNRPSASAKLVDETHMGEDWSKGQTTDILLTYSQTRAERLLKLARINVAKARTGQDKFQFLISQCYDIGQFVIDAHPMAQGYFEGVRLQAETDHGDAYDEADGD